MEKVTSHYLTVCHPQQSGGREREQEQEQEQEQETKATIAEDGPWKTLGQRGN
jgi:hypothetical protein